MREMSLQSDPQAMVRAYGNRMRADHAGRPVRLAEPPRPRAPRYRITRSSTWDKEVNPWRDDGKLPVFEGGLLGELLYGDEPRMIDDLQVDPGRPGLGLPRGPRGR